MATLPNAETLPSFLIGERRVGPGHPSFVIAEVAQAHDGSLGTAHAYIDAVARTGADAIKFQTHIAAAESSPDEPWRVRFSPQDDTRYEYWQRMEFTEEQWVGLAKHCHEKGLVFLPSAFSMQAMELLQRVGMDAWKIGSGEVTNHPLLERMAQTGKPVLLSSGMSTWNELQEAVNLVSGHGVGVALFQCTTSYPCPPEKIGLNVLGELKERFGCPIGLSDHSGTIYPSLAAAGLGATIFEAHVTFSKEAFGPDVSSSVTIDEMEQMVTGIRMIDTIHAHPIQKEEMAEDLEELRQIFGKSIVAARDLEKGTVLRLEDLDFRKPGSGVSAKHFREYINKTLNQSVSSGAMILQCHIE